MMQFSIKFWTEHSSWIGEMGSKIDCKIENLLTFSIIAICTLRRKVCCWFFPRNESSFNLHRQLRELETLWKVLFSHWLQLFARQNFLSRTKGKENRKKVENFQVKNLITREKENMPKTANRNEHETRKTFTSSLSSFAFVFSRFVEERNRTRWKCGKITALFLHLGVFLWQCKLGAYMCTRCDSGIRRDDATWKMNKLKEEKNDGKFFLSVCWSFTVFFLFLSDINKTLKSLQLSRSVAEAAVRDQR